VVFLSPYNNNPISSFTVGCINTSFPLCIFYVLMERQITNSSAENDLPCCLFEPAVARLSGSTRLHAHQSCSWQSVLGFVGTMTHQSSTGWLLKCHTPPLHLTHHYLGSSIRCDCPSHNSEADPDLVDTTQLTVHPYTNSISAL
jgi:hypothetical protein